MPNLFGPSLAALSLAVGEMSSEPEETRPESFEGDPSPPRTYPDDATAAQKAYITQRVNQINNRIYELQAYLHIPWGIREYQEGDFEILQHPHECLSTPCDEVTLDDVQDGSLREWVSKMLWALAAAPTGAAIAANQVGVSKRVIVFSPRNVRAVMVNPTVIKAKKRRTAEEMCLSFVGQGPVKTRRYSQVHVEYISLSGNKVKIGRAHV